LLALLTSLQRKEKGFAYLDTHAGRGSYDLSAHPPEAAAGIGRLTGTGLQAEELIRYTELVAAFRRSRGRGHWYPGSPVIAAQVLRPQDRATLSEIVPTEARLLERELEGQSRMRVERGDGFELLRAWLPPPERRGLILLDPPYEESRNDFDRVSTAITASLQRFGTGVIAAWYPVKVEREVRAWQAGLARAISTETLVSELWLYPRDSQVALNGSGLLIVNPPYRLAERMRLWLPELQTRLDAGHAGGTRIATLTGA
jgi:23S rRNA (adenine2030-N6)-methyltransferase